MDFYLKLASIEDDKKLKGIVLFEDLGETLVLGQGRKEYNYFLVQDYEYYVNEIVDIIDEIHELVPNSRICYQSAQHSVSGGIDSLLKMENDDTIYYATEWWCESWFDDDDNNEEDTIGTDSWCNRVIELSEQEL